MSRCPPETVWSLGWLMKRKPRAGFLLAAGETLTGFALKRKEDAMFYAVHNFPELHPNDAPETKPCPKCGKKMIHRSANIVLPLGGFGEIRGWIWWCGCGHEEPGGKYTVKSFEQLERERWEAINKED